MSVIDTILERFDGALAPLFARRISDDAEDSDSGKAKDMFGFVTKVNDGEQNSDGSITISGVAADFSGLTSLDGDMLTVVGGVVNVLDANILSP